MGTCNGVSSACAIGGYAMESRCHLGKVGVYDTVSKLGWSVNTRTHAIKTVIDVVLKEDWDPEHGISVPVPEEEVDCVVRFPCRNSPSTCSLTGDTRIVSTGNTGISKNPMHSAYESSRSLHIILYHNTLPYN
jgi:hypothetical protein